MTDPADILAAIEAAETDDERQAVIVEGIEEIEQCLLNCNHLFIEGREAIEMALMLLRHMLKERFE